MRSVQFLLCLFLVAGFATPAADSAPAERFFACKVERIAPAQAPVLDGALDDAAWAGKAAITNLRNFLGPLRGEAATQKTEIVLMSDGARLYIGTTFFDDDMKSIQFNPANAAFWNDCIELYFDPRHDGTRSIQLVVDCGAQRFWHKRFDDGYGWWDDNSWHMLARWEAAVKRGADRWTMELAIDCASFGIQPLPGKVCGFNACRFRLGSKQQEFSAWNYGPNGAQKDMTAWGHLLFGAEGQTRQGQPVTRADVQTVYPSLAGRAIEVPVDGGLVRYTADAETKQTFTDILAPLVQAAQEDLHQAAEALTRLPAGNPHAAELQKRQAELDKDMAATLQDAAAPSLTLGGYDKLSDRLRKATDASAAVLWKARLAELVAAK